MIVTNQYKIRNERFENNVVWKRSDYWLLQFPFEIHFSWICAAFILNLNIVGVDLGASADTQVIIAAISLLILALGAWTCLRLHRPQFTFAWVVAWATVSCRKALRYLIDLNEL